VHMGRCIVTIFSRKSNLWSNFFCHMFAISSLSFLFLVFQHVFACSFPYWCLFAQVLMSHSLYLRIVQVVEGHDDYFVKKYIEINIPPTNLNSSPLLPLHPSQI
jgi:hypothetical protein